MELDLGCRVDVEIRECFSLPEILESKAQCEPARYRGAAPSLQCPFGLAGPVFEVVPRHLCRRRSIEASSCGVCVCHSHFCLVVQIQ